MTTSFYQQELTEQAENLIKVLGLTMSTLEMENSILASKGFVDRQEWLESLELLKDKMSITWDFEDIESVCLGQLLNQQDKRDLLESMQCNFNPEIGINHEVISQYISNYLVNYKFTAEQLTIKYDKKTNLWTDQKCNQYYILEDEEQAQEYRETYDEDALSKSVQFSIEPNNETSGVSFTTEHSWTIERI